MSKNKEKIIVSTLDGVAYSYPKELIERIAIADCEKYSWNMAKFMARRKATNRKAQAKVIPKYKESS